jgi:hypothetical protein
MYARYQSVAQLAQTALIVFLGMLRILFESTYSAFGKYLKKKVSYTVRYLPFGLADPVIVGTLTFHDVEQLFNW